MRPIHAALVLFALVLGIGGAYVLIRADESSAEVATAAPSAPAPSSTAGAAASELDAPERPEENEPARVAGTSEPVAAAKPAADDEGEAGTKLVGRVVDSFGNAVSEATVYAAPPSPLGDSRPLDQLDDQPWLQRTEATTDDRGRFEISVEDVARTRIAVRAPRYVPYDGELAVSVGEERDVGDLPLEESVVLQGRVIDESGRGVAGAELKRMQSSEGGFRFTSMGLQGVLLTTTDDQGMFEVNQLAAGPWRIGITHEQHPDAIVTGETERPGQVVNGLQFVVDNGLSITGMVTGAPEGALDEMHIVSMPDIELGKIDDTDPVTRRTVPVEADGTFTVEGLREGKSYRLQGREGSGRTFGLFGRSLTEAVVAQPGDRNVELKHRPETALVFQVVDDETDQPLEDFDVSAGVRFPMPMRADSGRAVKHHPEGQVRFGSLPSTSGNDRVTLKIEATGYVTYERTDIVADAGIDTDLGVIRMTPAPTVIVRVVDDETNTPVERARVRLEEAPDMSSGGSFMMTTEIDVDIDEGSEMPDVDDLPVLFGNSKTARTDEEGIARLTSMPGEEVQIVVRAKGYAPYTSEPITLPLDKDLEYDVRVGLGGTVLVRVVDPDGNPMAGEKVSREGPGSSDMGIVFGSSPKVTDANGELLFENLEPGMHTFQQGEGDNGTVSFSSGGASFNMVRRVNRSGGAPEPDPETVEVEVLPGGSETVTLVAKRKSGLVGRVTEAGMSLAGATVSLVEAGGAAMAMPGLDMLGGGGPESRTNGSGEYSLDGVEVGDYTLRVTHPSRAMPYEQPVEVVDGGSEIDVDLPATVIRGQITDVQGQPLEGVRVRPEKYEGGERRVVRQVMIMMTDDGGDGQMLQSDGGFDPVVTDANGEYELRGVQPDVELVVRAEGEGVQPGGSKPVRLLPGDVLEGVDVELQPGGKLVVEAVRPDGSGASMVMISAEYVDEEGLEPKSGFTNKSGKATLDGLRPGAWKISARPLGLGGGGGGEGENPEVVVEVVAGENEPARIEMP